MRGSAASQAANDWAAKRKEQMARAAELREQRKREKGGYNDDYVPPPARPAPMSRPSYDAPMEYQPDYYSGGSGSGSYSAAPPPSDPYGGFLGGGGVSHHAPVAGRRASGRPNMPPAAPSPPPQQAPPSLDAYYATPQPSGTSASKSRHAEEADEVFYNNLRSEPKGRGGKSEWTSDFTTGSHTLTSDFGPPPPVPRSTGRTPSSGSGGYQPSFTEKGAQKRTESIARLKALKTTQRGGGAPSATTRPSWDADPSSHEFGAGDSDDEYYAQQQAPAARTAPRPAVSRPGNPRMPFGQQPFSQGTTSMARGNAPAAQAPRGRPPVSSYNPMDDRAIAKGMGAMSMMDEDAAGEPQDLIECGGCGRSFNPKAFQVHQRVCAKVFQQKRKVFNALEKALPQEALKVAPKRGGRALPPSTQKGGRPGAAAAAPSSAASEKALPGNKKQKWLAKSEAFRNAIRAAKGLPPLPGSSAAGGGGGGFGEPDDDYVPCPYCNRRFAPLTAERHIPKCKDTINKPGRLVRGGGIGAGAFSTRAPAARQPLTGNASAARSLRR